MRYRGLLEGVCVSGLHRPSTDIRPWRTEDHEWSFNQGFETGKEPLEHSQDFWSWQKFTRIAHVKEQPGPSFREWWTTSSIVILPPSPLVRWEYERSRVGRIDRLEVPSEVCNPHHPLSHWDILGDTSSPAIMLIGLEGILVLWSATRGLELDRHTYRGRLASWSCCLNLRSLVCNHLTS